MIKTNGDEGRWHKRVSSLSSSGRQTGRRIKLLTDWTTDGLMDLQTIWSLAVNKGGNLMIAEGFSTWRWLYGLWITGEKTWWDLGDTFFFSTKKLVRLLLIYSSRLMIPKHRSSVWPSTVVPVTTTMTTTSFLVLLVLTCLIHNLCCCADAAGDLENLTSAKERAFSVPSQSSQTNQTSQPWALTWN